MSATFQFKSLSFADTDEQEIISYIKNLESEIKSCHTALEIIHKVTQDYFSSAEENI